ncbi:MAG: PLP-dependent aminotransferase family protein [Nitrospirota bacterium]|nr:PLP-dependent aminotransferase family protein [Nitrospirota bacterium]
MDSIFSDRIIDVPRSFIREILKVALDPTVISFAGGLPNRELFPAEEIKAATSRVFDIYGRDIFQYSNSEGYPELREYISERYRQKKKLDIPVENILITNGSQQGLDLLGKVLINDGDGLIIEEPGYLGAIQAFSIYKAEFLPVPVGEEGMHIKKLRSVMTGKKPKLMYTVPTFQNPSGICYSESNRLEITEILKGARTLLIEDDPYGDLRFSGDHKQSFKALLPDNTVLLGSFSKIVVPGFRLGWIVAPDRLMKKLVIAKQAADLHTSYFTQCVMYQYLKDNDIDAHIKKIIQVYGKQQHAMLESIERYFPSDVGYTRPEGGMFLWATLPEHVTSLELFDLAVKDKVIFVPGDPFYVNRSGTNTLRLSFSCVDAATIKTGICRLGKAIDKLLT